MTLIRLSSSSSRPLVIPESSSLAKWVKIPETTLARYAWAVTNKPHCIISWATPTLRRKVDFPPELAPVMMTSDFAVGLHVVAGDRSRGLQHQARIAQFRCTRTRR